MNSRNATLLKKLGSNDKKGKRLWNSLSDHEKHLVHLAFEKNPKFATHGLPAIIEAVRDFRFK